VRIAGRSTLPVMAEPAAGYDERLELTEAELDRLTRRLRSLSPRAWQTRRAYVVETLRALAEIGRAAERRDAYVVPDLPDYALPDAVAVIGRDALEALARTPVEQLLDRLLSELREALDSTR